MSQLKPGQVQRTCPSCRIRHTIPPSSWSREHYSAIEVEEGTIRFLKAAAAFFDLEADAPHTAQEFVEWLLPDLRGRHKDEDMAGKAIVQGGNRTGGAGAGRIAQADPIPYAGMSARRMVG